MVVSTLNMELKSPTTRIREAAHLSVAELAAKVGCSQAYAYRMESALGGVSKRFALGLVDHFSAEMAALELTIEDLLRGEWATPTSVGPSEEQGAEEPAA